MIDAHLSLLGLYYAPMDAAFVAQIATIECQSIGSPAENSKRTSSHDTFVFLNADRY